MRSLRLVCLASALVLATAARAEPSDAYAWLQRMANAAHGLNYQGTFVYQRGTRVETLRIVHRVEDGREFAKLAALDGAPRETYRMEDEVLCLLPDGKTAIADKSYAARVFPVLLPAQVNSLKEAYRASLAGRERVAGRQAQLIVLDPRDGFRYAHRFWADTASGLPLKAMISEDGKEVLEHFSFSQVTIGGAIAKEEVRPDLSGRRVVRNTGSEGETTVDPGWDVGFLPPAFKRIAAVKRYLPGHVEPVNHLVYSDGLAAVSLFIGRPGGTPAGGGGVRIARNGALHVYTRWVDDHQIKVVGEVPEATVRQIGDSVSRAKP